MTRTITIIKQLKVQDCTYWARPNFRPNSDHQKQSRRKTLQEEIITFVYFSSISRFPFIVLLFQPFILPLMFNQNYENHPMKALLSYGQFNLFAVPANFWPGSVNAVSADFFLLNLSPIRDW